MLNTLKPRHIKLLDNFARTSNLEKSAIEAGYTPETARARGKDILNTAIRLQTQNILNKATNKEITTQEAKTENVLDIIGLTRKEVVERLKHIANQDKDYSSALKVLSVASKSIGYDITNTDTPNTTPSILNVIVDSNNMANNKDIVEGEVVK